MEYYILKLYQEEKKKCPDVEQGFDRFEPKVINPDIVCINYQNYQKDIKEMLAKETGKLIVIDNADILLDDDTRKYISMDEKNQYLIIGRNPKNLFTTNDNLFELVSEKKGEQTEFRLKKYL